MGVSFVEHSVSIDGSGAHGEHFAVRTRPVGIHVVQTGSLEWGNKKRNKGKIESKTSHLIQTYPFVESRDHDSHGQSHAFVVVGDVGEQLGGRCHGDPLVVTQLVETALLGEDAFPVGAVGGATGHGAQQELVDLDNFLHRAGA